MKEEIGDIDYSILFECILRRLEIEDLKDSDKNQLLKIYDENNSVGFHTYGEQFGPIHLNQTLVGVVFGKKQ